MMASLSQPLRQVKQAWHYYARYVTTPYLDWKENRRLVDAAEGRFLMLRHPAHLTRYYDSFVHWIERKMPDVRSRCELQSLPCSIRDWSRYRVLVPWIPDPMLYTCPRVYRRVKKIEEICEDFGIAVINPADAMLNTAKSTGAEIMRSVGLRTPKAAAIAADGCLEDTLEAAGIEYPMLIREDRAHAGRLPIFHVDNAQDLQQVPIHEFDHPIAVEFIDVSEPDTGLSRRYRYFAAGESGMAMNIHCSSSWEVRGKNAVHGRQLEVAEIAFASQPDPNAALLQKARRALGLDFVAFDYSYRPNGELVVWEANVMPGLGYAETYRNRHYRREIAERAFALTLNLYYTRANLPVPPSVLAIVEPTPEEWFSRVRSQAA